jgi:galactokinase
VQAAGREVVERFVSITGEDPSVTVRSPGRVNLIGDHTDYSNLPVLPLAIDRAIHLAAAPGEPGTVVADSLGFPSPLTAPTDALDPAATTGWHRYLAAVLRVLGERADLRALGLRLLLGGDLPATGGLSSSAAFFVGVLETCNRLWGLGIPRTDLPGLAGRAEHAIGLESGGMDQTVIALADAGCALRIDFAPVRWRSVPVPDGLAVVAAYSGQQADKGAAANLAYNSRVVTCRAAAAALRHRLGLEVDNDGPLVLGDLSGLDSVDALAGGLPSDTTPAAVAADCGIDVGRLVQLTAKRLDVDLAIDPRTVAVHVLSEARRVDDAEQALLDGDHVALGRLLDASHESLVRFGASSAALDRVTAAMRAAGAFGARVTGAGFGGYAVSVAPADRVTAVVDAAVAATGGPAFPVVPSAGVGPL